MKSFMSEVSFGLLVMLILYSGSGRVQCGWTHEGYNDEFYSLTAVNADGQTTRMSLYTGKVLLLVNVASECGYTHEHYQELVQLQSDFTDTGLFHVLAFPCNQFGQQEPMELHEIIQHVSNKYNVNFPIFAKVNVTGSDAAQLWKYISDQTGQVPQWNFSKYMVDHRGNVIGPWGAQVRVRDLEPVVKKAVAAAHRDRGDKQTASKATHPNALGDL